MLEDSILYGDVDEELVERFKRERDLELKITAPLELTLNMGRGLNVGHTSRFSYQHFYNHLPYAQEVYLIAYNIPPEPITKANIIKRVWDLNNERDWEGPKLGVVTGFGEFGDFSDFKQDLGNYEYGSIQHKEAYQSNEFKKRYVNQLVEKFLPDELKACIYFFSNGDVFPEGFHFYPNLHSKVYFSDRLVYIGSSNLSTGALSNAEVGFVTRNKKILRAVCAYYRALVEEGFLLDSVKLPESQKHLDVW